MVAADATRELAKLWSLGHGDAGALRHVSLTGRDPALPSIFAVGALAQASIAASALAAAELHRVRGGPAQIVSVDMRHAVADFRSERYFSAATPIPPMWDAIAGLYQCNGGRWIRIHTNFPHHRDGVLKILGAANTRDAVQAAFLSWDAAEFEAAAADANLVATMTRTRVEWAAHAQGRAVAALPLLEVDQLAPSPPKALPLASRPLSGVRVLDLTRIIAGPVAGRTLAAHGADVLAITSPNLPSIPSLVMDTGRGKRTAHLDLDTQQGIATLSELIRSADVFLHGYRPGGLAARGFSDGHLQTLNPALVVASLSAYGHIGPWANRRGFDSLTQNANGLNWEEAEAANPGLPVARPKELPAQALDHAAGYLLAFGVMRALALRQAQGGSWRVRTSLAQVGHWLSMLPRVPGGDTTPDLTRETIADLLETSASGFGPITAVRHAAQLSATPAHWLLPAMPLGSHNPIWAP